MRVTVAVLVGALGLTRLLGGWPAPPGHRAVARPAANCSLTQGADQRGRPARLPLAPDAQRCKAPAATSVAASVLGAPVDIPLPGRPVRFDYQTEDPQSGLLYISHMHDAHIVVFDTRARQIVGRVAETPGVTGV